MQISELREYVLIGDIDNEKSIGESIRTLLLLCFRKL